MFDLSFGEIVLALVVAFVIFGPERFPVMLRDAIGWIKKIKTMAFEAQKTLDDLGKNIKEELPNPNLWTSTSSISQTPKNNTSTLKPVEIDRDPQCYEKESMNWRSTLTVDRDKKSYRSQPLKVLPWKN